MTFERLHHRAYTSLRTISLVPGYAKYAQGSCLVQFGETHVLCTATVEERVPPFLKNTGSGWITAEYGMLPCATPQRNDREAARGKQTGRTQEIQRLIGRSLRAVMPLKALGERQIRIDCDVLQADGGTRTASITGAYVALALACRTTKIKGLALLEPVAAISCGLVQGVPLLDLDYAEDSTADVDANFVMTGQGRLIEIQASAEKSPFEESTLQTLLQYARQGIGVLVELQQKALVSPASASVSQDFSR